MFSRGRKQGNDTIDVANKSCFIYFDTLACVRTCLLVIFAILTLLLILLKLIKYHVLRHPQIHHFAIFYISAGEIVLCAAAAAANLLVPQLEFAAYFLRLLQLAAVCHLHWSLYARTPVLVQNVVNPVLCLYILYCTTVALMGMVDISDTWTQCMRPYYVMLSSADLLMVQLFVGVALYVTRRADGISSLASFKGTQKRDLWSIIVVYEFSALLTVTHDAVMRFVGTEAEGCSALFAHRQIFYSMVASLLMLVKFLVPTWTLLCVFQPVEGDTHNSEVALASRYNTADGTSEPGFHQYQRMTSPLSPHLLPFVSDFTSLGNGEQPHTVVASLGHKKLPPKDRKALSTISEESYPASALDSPCSQRDTLS
ncbi:uncharacterized protein LOC124621980 [Schistocerca americana]|uniref:uncharacterized protein LOC124621980 n=1 Tax=Schistocerca americana TaxID=7009 RepID=UPI001F4FB98B|nr:uncharacterized protein LOC124621980 [Schistocerca americana]XP_047120909.1 uncharacterized protein LOC124804698 [Schistocerca piceifrons]XP_049764794.1 uncharacterized protein LOC126094457 [Schistocerca cancellata]XP_049790953.1 uncharacterized protein LOC126198566 [Schistocerca nitens]XP_049938727.1 uncharacterized protein LOC126412881 [Schistocerca serialis cubense]